LVYEVVLNVAQVGQSITKVTFRKFFSLIKFYWVGLLCK